MDFDLERVRRLVKSELAVTSVIRLAKISDEPCESRRVAVPNASRASSKDDGRRLSRGVNPYQTVRSSAKTNKTEPRVLSPVFPTLQTFKV